MGNYVTLMMQIVGNCLTVDTWSVVEGQVDVRSADGARVQALA